METQPDFRELLALFNARHVEYLIVGGYALAFHGAPRFTGDLDIFVKPDAVNAQRILHALEAFGFASVGLTRSDFERLDQVVQLGVPPVRIDLITSITGVSWDEAWVAESLGATGIRRCIILAGSSSSPTNAPQAERKTWRTWKCSGKHKIQSPPRAEPSTARAKVNPKPWNWERSHEIGCCYPVGAHR